MLLLVLVLFETTKKNNQPPKCIIFHFCFLFFKSKLIKKFKSTFYFIIRFHSNNFFFIIWCGRICQRIIHLICCTVMNIEFYMMYNVVVWYQKSISAGVSIVIHFFIELIVGVKWKMDILYGISCDIFRCLFLLYIFLFV